jgi:hypothetical protein
LAQQKQRSLCDRPRKKPQLEEVCRIYGEPFFVLLPHALSLKRGYISHNPRPVFCDQATSRPIDPFFQLGIVWKVFYLEQCDRIINVRYMKIIGLFRILSVRFSAVELCSTTTRIKQSAGL